MATSGPSAITGGGLALGDSVLVGIKAVSGQSGISGGGAVSASSKKNIVATAGISGDGNVHVVSWKVAGSSAHIKGGGRLTSPGHRVGRAYVFPQPSVPGAVTEVRLTVTARTVTKTEDTFNIVLMERTSGLVLETVTVPVNSWLKKLNVPVAVTRANLLNGINARIDVPPNSAIRLNQFTIKVISPSTRTVITGGGASKSVGIRTSRTRAAITGGGAAVSVGVRTS